MPITRVKGISKYIYDAPQNRLKTSEITLPGNVLLVTAFISYMGCFTRKYRMDLMNLHWLPFLDNLQVPIPHTPDLDPLSLMTDDAKIAQWNNDGKIVHLIFILLFYFIYLNRAILKIYLTVISHKYK